MSYNIVIRELRERYCHTQEKVGKFLNVCQHTYCDYESGKTRIPVDSLIILAKLYNVDMNYICGLSEEVNPFPVEKSS